MIAIASLLLVVLVGLLITRLATLALVATGLSRESAQFQARSAFTRAGFTTGEAEAVVEHPVRRRIVMFLMLAGNAGVASVGVGLLVGFGDSSGSAAGLRAAVLFGGVVAIFLVARAEWVDRHLRSLLSRLLSRYSDIDVRDYAEILHIAGDYVINELAVQPGDWLCDRTLGELRLRDEGVAVLGIDRSDGYMGTPGSDTRLREGDRLLLYGRGSVICELDERRSNAQGQKAHADREKEHDLIRLDEAITRDSSLRAEGGSAS